MASNVGEQYGFDFSIPLKRPIRLWTADELYDDMNQLIAFDAAEDSRIERKRATYNARDLGDYFSMWANTPPHGGIILLGVENGGEISGCLGVDPDHLNELERAGVVFASEARCQSKRVNVQNKNGVPDYIVAIRVFYRPDRVVETAGKKTFVRTGSCKREIDEAEKRELQLLKGQLEIESEPSTLAYPSEFNANAIESFAAAVARERHMPDRSNEEILQLRRLGKVVDGRFTPNLGRVDKRGIPKRVEF